MLLRRRFFNFIIKWLQLKVYSTYILDFYTANKTRFSQFLINQLFSNKSDEMLNEIEFIFQNLFYYKYLLPYYTFINVTAGAISDRRILLCIFWIVIIAIKAI